MAGGPLQGSRGPWPRWGRVSPVNAYGGYNDLYRADREPGPVTGALCWAHARRKFFVLADIADIAGRIRKGKPAHDSSPVALEAVTRIDALFDIERELNGLSAEARREARQRLSRPLLEGLRDRLQVERAQMPRHADVAKAIDYMFKKGRWPTFTLFLEDGRICLTNNCAERALRGVALGRKSWLFAGSERGGDRAAFTSTLIVTAKLTDIDPFGRLSRRHWRHDPASPWLADVLARMPNPPVSRLPELLPWNWRSHLAQQKAA